MNESIIYLENISLVDFLGANHVNFEEIALAFPGAKIVSRGNEIRIKGKPDDIIKIQEIINSLLKHFSKFGHLQPEQIHKFLNSSVEDQNSEKKDAILHSSKGSAIKPKNKNQQKLADSVLTNDIVFVVGPAGTGKTYMAVALALQALKNKEIKKIIVTRPAVEAGENLGFLPGDLNEKIYPYLRPVFDAFEEMVAPEKLKFYQENNIIEIAPLAYMRGRTLNQAFIILDEAQNATNMQLKMFLTRLGIGSKAVITGDLTQIDLPRKDASGLSDAVQRLGKISGIDVVVMKATDGCRHPLVSKIVKAYGDDE
ncbi:MAG: PhoH family protein [Opitutaceae bacterium]|nr:PhoH family protein [Cytophagales bacterium]